MALTEKQKAFCREYLIDLNAAAAYRRAGYSPKGANALASRLIANDSIQEEIQRLVAERAERTEVDADDVLRGLHALFLAGSKKADQVTARDAIQAAGVLLHHLDPIPDDADKLRTENARLRALVEQYEIDHEQV